MHRIVLILLLVIVLSGAGFVAYKAFGPKTSFQTEKVDVNLVNEGGGTQLNDLEARAREIVIETKEYQFSPREIRVKKGETVKITLKNTGKMQHDWVVEGMEGARADLTQPGESTTIVLTPSQAGRFVTYCSFGSHRQQGQTGTLVVE